MESIKYPPYGKNTNTVTHLSYTWALRLFISLSDLYLARSSTKSLMAVTANTKSSGNIAISLPNALIWGIQFRIMINKKYTFAKRWNCSNRFFGRNVRIVYLVVLIWLFLCVVSSSWLGWILGMTVHVLLGVRDSWEFGGDGLNFTFIFAHPVNGNDSSLKQDICKNIRILNVRIIFLPRDD